MKILPVICLLAFGWLPLRGVESPAAAKDASPLPGHSLNGEAFDEGPRQAAVLMPGIGNAHFSITTKNEQAQKFFDQGVGQLHGFWYFEAERSFRQAAALDPDCAIAFWGMAMANINNQKRAARFHQESDRAERQGEPARTALDRQPRRLLRRVEARRKAAPRAGSCKRWSRLIFEFPDDLEANAFLVFQIWDNKGHGMPLASRTAVDALGKQVLAVNPMHPGVHHYLIHLWNGPNSDQHALPSAAARRTSGAGHRPHVAHAGAHLLQSRIATPMPRGSRRPRRASITPT